MLTFILTLVISLAVVAGAITAGMYAAGAAMDDE